MAPRNRSSSRRPLWIIVLIAFVCAVAIGAYLYTPRHYTACYLVPSEACNTRPPPEPARVYTDDEIAARAIMRDIIRSRPMPSKNPKIAFMFLTPSSLPFEKLWEKFFMGHDRYTLYVHASRDRTIHSSPIFAGRDIRSEKEGLVYAVEFSHRSGRDLVNMAKKRTNVIPIIEDARHPGRYRMFVGMVDVIFSDVAQPDQARILALNASYFLKCGGHFVMSIKANCIDCTQSAEAVFASEVEKLKAEQFKPAEQVTLEPFERDHACVGGGYRMSKKHKPPSSS